ncbi:rap1 GTPase-GDP dissociation stimulator 1-B [Cimex lectularius]|uniref:Rap1 GTPase-GDP dissociation stimulator 1-B n=1 Tax=Cimex lectularius TaxID=79782 RepID=A0A8I6RW35_CIMLE|nr:rap1 GTPase-GDP dissociation stimulator 1-B [Cimex lectularius]
MGDFEKLPLLLENLQVGNDNAEVIESLDNLISQVNDSEAVENIDIIKWANEVSNFLTCGNIEIETKAAEVIGDLCKSETPRVSLSNSKVIVPLVDLMRSNDNRARNQACRAVGNICFENVEGRSCFLQHSGLTVMVDLLKICALPECDLNLRMNAAGCFINFIMGQEKLYPKLVELGVVEILCDILTYGVSTKEAEQTAIHIYVTLWLMTDSGTEIFINEKLCGVTVKILEESTNGELSELCVELLHREAENEDVRLHLAKAGLCELLIELMEKHSSLVDDDETRNLLKMACDLIIIILNGDASMQVAFGNGKGKVFEGMISWLDSQDDDLQVTAVLAIANFARTDMHCTQMVSQGVSKKLLSILSQNNTSGSKIRLQHALLSALRNLVIPSVNKGIVLQQGLLQALYPMFNIPTFPVVFKLLGTLRIVIDGQPEAASELGNREDLIVNHVVPWCDTDDHPGVQGEAYRLLVWIIKNSRDRDVIGKLVSCGVIERLVKMTATEHVIMHGEAFLALNLTMAMRGQDATMRLLNANVGQAITKFLASTPTREVFHNLLAFVGQLVNSSELRKHLCEAGVPKALYSTILGDSLADLRDQVTRLATMLDNG